MAVASIAPDQRRRIFALCRELGWDDDMRRDMMTQWVGKPSLSATAEKPVTYAEARSILGNLSNAVGKQARGRAAQKKRRRRHWPKDQPTPEQLREIDRLQKLLFPDQPAKFRAWLKRQFQLESTEWLSPKQATACILALRQMQKQGWQVSRSPTVN